MYSFMTFMGIGLVKFPVSEQIENFQLGKVSGILENGTSSTECGNFTQQKSPGKTGAFLLGETSDQTFLTFAA
jgi:hypothetical protein